MADTTREDTMALLQHDRIVLHGSRPIEHHLGRQLRRVYEAMPMPVDPQLDALVKQLTTRMAEGERQD